MSTTKRNCGFIGLGHLGVYLAASLVRAGHNVTITDDYHWLRDASYPTIDDTEILAHLNAENAYFEAQMAPQAKLTETIFQEMKGRVKEDD